MNKHFTLISSENTARRESKVVLDDEITAVAGKTYEEAARVYPPSCKKFAVLTGDRPNEERQIIQDIYNNKNNLYGENLALLLVTEVGTRGISLIAGIYTYAMESYWTYHLFDQLEGRIVRNGSHLMLPPELRETRMFIYLSDKPTLIRGDDPELAKLDDPEEGYTSDAVIYHRAIKRQLILDQFITTLKEVAIECPNLNSIVAVEGEKINCYRCQSTNQPLYSDNLDRDLSVANPCQKLREVEIEVYSIMYEGVEYKYSKVDKDSGEFTFDEYIIYDRDKNGNWKKMSDRSLYENILTQIK